MPVIITRTIKSSGRRVDGNVEPFFASIAEQSRVACEKFKGRRRGFIAA